MYEREVIPSANGARPSGAAGASVGGWLAQFLRAPTVVPKLSASTRRELEVAAVRIADKAADKAVLLAAPAGDTARRGIVIGAVQSGKTAFFSAVAGAAFDRGVDCVVVLAGLRDDLRRQTARRLVRDLLCEGKRIIAPMSELAATPAYDHPLGAGHHGEMISCWALNPSLDATHDEAFVYQVSRNLRARRRVLLVVKKHLRSLDRTREALQSAAAQRLDGSPLTVLILDDESDEATVAVLEGAPTPEAICALWSSPQIRASYVGVTATAAANILAETDNPLYPRDFIELLRTPGVRDTPLTFYEPDADRRYTGGHVFYEWLQSAGHNSFFVRSAMSGAEFAGEPGYDEELEEALIAYFVSGAMRLCEAPGRSLDDPAQPPPPHTMMAHTEAEIDQHWDLCRRIVAIVDRRSEDAAAVRQNTRLLDPSARLAPERLQRWLEREPMRWQRWHDDFLESRRVLLRCSPDRNRPASPGWSDVVARLPEVFRRTKLRVINSDEASTDPELSFERARTADGWQPPYDVYSIVVGGNRLSRGLTLEGLCVSYYTRSAQQYMEDTTVQRERWFGYRGPYLEYCRVFTHASMAARLARFHCHDEDLRRQVGVNLTSGLPPVTASLRFLRMRDSLPTAKLGRGVSGSVAASGVSLFVDRVENGTDEVGRSLAEQNEVWAAAICRRVRREGSARISADGVSIGWLLPGVPAREIADLLDSLSYSAHNPDPLRGARMNLGRWHRPCAAGRPVIDAFPAVTDPYLIAAYLRWWDSLARTPGAVSSPPPFGPDGVSPWVPCAPPIFNVGVRTGSIVTTAESSAFDFPLVQRLVRADGVVASRWGGRSDDGVYFGDQWFDMDPPGGDGARPRTHSTPGLLLIYVIAAEAMGRSRRGVAAEFHRPTVGLVVPQGGPSVEFVVTRRSANDR